MGGLFGLCGIGIANMFLHLPLLHSIGTYGGLALFTALNAYGTAAV